MDFTYTDEQNEIKELSNKILQEQVTPEAHKALEEKMKEGSPRFDSRLWATVADAGLLGIAIEEAHGGMGFGFMELSLFLEEAGRVVAPLPIIPTVISAITIQKFGNDEQKAMLGGTVTGEVVLTAAINEPMIQEGYTPFLKATQNGDAWELTGVKACVPFTNIASQMLVTAQTDNGPAVFIADPKSDAIESTDVIATTFEPQAQLEFKGTPATKLGDADAVKYLVDHYTTAICAHQTGATDAAMRLTSSYVAEREQFGVKIGTFQAVGHKAADQFINVGCLRLVTQQAASLLHMGVEAEKEIRAAKVWAGDAGHRVSYNAQQLHGGMGVDRDYPLWRYALWIRSNEMTLGSSAHHLAQMGKAIAEGKQGIPEI